MSAVLIPLLWQAAFLHFVNKRKQEEVQIICVSVFDGRPRRGRISDAFEHVTGVYVVLEQPSSSLLFSFEAVAQALDSVRARRVAVSMQAFGGTSRKSLALVGTAPWLEDLQRESRDRRSFNTSTENLCTVDDNGAVTGRRSEMKASEEYTAEFSETCACSVTQEVFYFENL
eukprot:s1448_g8.t1